MKSKLLWGIGFAIIVFLAFGNMNVTNNAETSPPGPACITTYQ